MYDLLKPLHFDGTWSRQWLQQAMIETALAYYWKNIDVQYDSKHVTAQERGYTRLSSLVAPEDADFDNTVYSVCSAFMNEVVYHTFGVPLMDTTREAGTGLMLELPLTDPRVVMRYGNGGMADKAEALKVFREKLEPGDVIVGYGKTGHTLMYIGDFLGDGTDYVIHCWGTGYDAATGIDKVEQPQKLPGTHPLGGAIRIDPIDELVLSDAGKSSFTDDSKFGREFGILRLLDHPKCQHTPEKGVLTRLRYRGICVYRTCGEHIYSHVCPGERLTVTVTVQNHSTAPYIGVPVEDAVPGGAVLLPESISQGGTVEGSRVKWVVDVPAGRSTRVSYDVIVTAAPGTKVTLRPGKVDNLATRSFSLPVSAARLSAQEEDRFRHLDAAALTGDMSELRLAKACYKAVLGVELPLPDTFNALMPMLFSKAAAVRVPESYGGKMYVRRKDAPEALTDMLISDHCTGFAVYIGENPKHLPMLKSAYNRVKRYDERYYRPGDVFITLDRCDVFESTSPDHVHVYVYLGDGTVAACEGGRACVRSFYETVELMPGMPVTLGLRPGNIYGGKK